MLGVSNEFKVVKRYKKHTHENTFKQGTRQLIMVVHYNYTRLFVEVQSLCLDKVMVFLGNAIRKCRCGKD